jgi:hypothetical protein
MRLASLLFGYGAIVHFMMYRVMALPADPKFQAMKALDIGISLLGGLVVLILFYRPSSRISAGKVRFLSRMGLLGVLATFLVVEVCLVLQAIGATAAGWDQLRELPYGTRISAFGLMLLSVHVYGALLLVRLIPLGFLQGVIAGILVQCVKLTTHPRSE